MRHLIVNLASKIQHGVKVFKIEKKLKEFLAQIDESHPFKSYPVANVGDCSASPKEFFSHYDAYCYWMVEKLRGLPGRKKILDVGNEKIANAVNSVNHDVTALVLMDCEDRLSKVNYVIHDISEALPFEDNVFDVFTSCASLHLVGLGRYGDRLNAYALPRFIKELDRVMKPTSDLIFSFTYGPNCLQFNKGWIFNYESIVEMFSQWKLVDYLIDNHSVPNPIPYKERFSKDLDLSNVEDGQYRVIFLHFKR